MAGAVGSGELRWGARISGLSEFQNSPLILISLNVCGRIIHPSKYPEPETLNPKP